MLKKIILLIIAFFSLAAALDFDYLGIESGGSFYFFKEPEERFYKYSTARIGIPSGLVVSTLITDLLSIDTKCRFTQISFKKAIYRTTISEKGIQDSGVTYFKSNDSYVALELLPKVHIGDGPFCPYFFAGLSLDFYLFSHVYMFDRWEDYERVEVQMPIILTTDFGFGIQYTFRKIILYIGDEFIKPLTSLHKKSNGKPTIWINNIFFGCGFGI